MRGPFRLITGIALAASAGVTMFPFTGCARKAPQASAAYRAEVERWRTQRLASLTGDDGWLTVVGLFWLKPGENRFGSDPGNEVVLRGHGVPAFAGSLDLRSDGLVTAHARPAGGATLAGQPVPERALRSDHDRKPDVLAVGSVRFYLIDRSGRLAVRVKDRESSARADFKRLVYFPINPAFRVEGTFEPYARAREVTVASAQGPAQKMLAPGLVRFTLAGRPLALEPFVSSPDDKEYFFVFRDPTAGHETYGAGRFLDVPVPAQGSRSVVLDFNYAYNPPCAFTPYATCPLPPRQNDLPIRIEAGEKFLGH
ncbi:MAG: DUF1684 domain-containing protein [Thermoanaerobaculales bacterium]